METKAMIFFPGALLLLLIFGGICLWGVSAICRKFGVGKTLFAAVLLLPALAVGTMLLALVSHRSHAVRPVPAVEYRAVEHQIAIEQEAEHIRQIAEAHAERGRQMAQAARERSLPATEEAPKIQYLDPVLVPQPAAPAGSSTVVSPNTSVPTTPTWVSLAVVAVIAMLVLSGMIGTSVYLAAQGGTLRWRAVGSKLLSIIWLIPALAMAAVPMYMVAAKVGGWTALASVSPTVVPAVEATASASHDEDGTTTGELPEWVSAPPHNDGQTRVVVVSSRYSPAVDASDTNRAIRIAQAEVYNKAAQQIRAYFAESYPVRGNWPIPDEIVRRSIGNVHLMEKSVDGGGKVYRRFAQVKLTPNIRQQLLPQWQKATTHERLWALYAGLGVLTLLTGTTAGYLRLDRMTDGAYRGRLKLASLSVITAGALVAGMLVG